MDKLRTILMSTIGAVILVIALGKAIPALWPSFVGSGTDIAALTQTDTTTELLQGFWPVILIIIGLAIVVGIVWAAIGYFKAK